MTSVMSRLARPLGSRLSVSGELVAMPQKVAAPSARHLASEYIAERKSSSVFGVQGSRFVGCGTKVRRARYFATEARQNPAR